MRKVKKFFSFKGRANRKEFAIVYAIAEIVGFIGNCFFLKFQTVNVLKTILFIDALILILMMPIAVRRLHDSGLPGQYIIVFFLPRIFFAMAAENLLFMGPTAVVFFMKICIFFRVGDEGKNQYDFNE
ncbi:MAG: DUF805 domain-containing protein [Anaerovoracaceae bacterium]